MRRDMVRDYLMMRRDGRNPYGAKGGYVRDSRRGGYDRNYREGVSKVVLEIRDLVLPKGKKIFIVGESGIGKSTILEVLGLMNNTIVKSAGTKFHFFDNKGECVDLLGLWDKNSDDALSDFRLKHFNFIFQSTNLMRNFTAYENIALTRMLQGYSQKDSFAKAAEVLADLGLGHIDEDRMANELSGGQQQRVSIARALANKPSLLLADEPTAALDSHMGRKVMELLKNVAHTHHTAVLVVTHDHRAIDVFDRIWMMEDGKLSEKNWQD